MKNEDDVKIASKFWNCISEQRWDAAKELLSDDFEAYWPQSKEKIVGADNFISVNSNYPGTHKIEFCNRTSSYDVWDHATTVITEVYIESKMPDGKEMKLFAISTFEIMDEKIMSLREYWAETYPAPEWRKQWVQIC
jgi:ketosteroid isomerase-like protein